MRCESRSASDSAFPERTGATALRRPPLSRGLVWPHTPHRISPGGTMPLAAYRESGGRNLEVAYLPARSFQRSRRGAVRIPRNPRSRATAGRPTAPTRPSAPRISSGDPRSRGRRGMAVVPPSAGFARRNGAHLFTLVLTPSLTSATRAGILHGIRPAGARGLPEGHFRRHGRCGHCRLAGSPGAPRMQVTVASHPAAPPRPRKWSASKSTSDPAGTTGWAA